MSKDTENKGIEPINNGNEFNTYKWTQNHKDVSIVIYLEKGLKPRDIQVNFFPNSISVFNKKNNSLLLSGDLYSIIKAENSLWYFDEDNNLVLELDKKKFDEWWKFALKGEPEINLQKIVTPNGSLEDLDQETRMTIDKMLFEEKMKRESGYYDRMNL